MAAGNLLTEGAQITAFPPPLKTRMIHFELGVDADSWIQWGSANGVDPRMLSFIGYKPHLLYNPRAGSSDFTFSCPRNITMASTLTKGSPITHEDVSLLAGTISEGVAREYIGYVKVYQNLPHIDKILANPESTPIPTEPSERYATSSHIAEHITQDNADTLMIYVQRLPLEIQTICLRMAMGRDHMLLMNDKIDAWYNINATRKVA